MSLIKHLRANIVWRPALCVIGLGMLLTACTDRIESTLPPVAPPPPRPQAEIPAHLKSLFSAHCASCHGAQGDGGSAGSIYKARSRNAKNWIAFLKNPRAVDANSKKAPITDLTEAEYAALAEWLARITKDNHPARAPESERPGHNL